MDYVYSVLALDYAQDLEMKKLPKAAKLGMLYHIHDLIGADRLERSVMRLGLVEYIIHLCSTFMSFFAINL